MRSLLTLSAILTVLFVVLIGIALIVADVKYTPHLQRLSAAFSPGACDQPCWRGIQVDKIGPSAMMNALKAMSDVTPNGCPYCLMVRVDNEQWLGAVTTIGPDNYLINLTTDLSTSHFYLLDSIAVFGTPASIQCAVSDLDPQHPSQIVYVTLYFDNGIQVISYEELSPFDGSLNPLWRVSAVRYQNPSADSYVSVFPWRGFKHITGQECHPGG